MSHSKCGTLVWSSTGEAWTSKRGARRLIDRQLAERQPDGTLRMYESDYRFRSEPQCTSGPDLQSMLRPFPIDVHLQDDRAVLKYWPDQSSPGSKAA